MCPRFFWRALVGFGGREIFWARIGGREARIYERACMHYAYMRVLFARVRPPCLIRGMSETRPYLGWIRVSPGQSESRSLHDATGLWQLSDIWS